MKINFRSILNLLRNNLLLKCLSLGISVIIWLVIVQYVNPEDTRRIENIPIVVTTADSVPAGEGLVLVTDYNKTMSITYTASRDVIAMLKTDSIKAYVDLSGATKSGEYSFPVRVDTGGQNITIVDQTVKEAVLKFEKSTTAQIKVNVTAEGSVPDGYVKNEPVCVPAFINVNGPESKVSKIASAEVTVPEKNFTQTNVYSCEYKFVDEKGEVVTKDYLTVDFDTVDVTVTVLKTKALPITASLVNSSGGYENNFVKMNIKPSTITVAGSDEMLETLNSYDLGSIDICEETKSFKREFVVTLPNGLKNVDGVTNANVEVDFGDIRTKTIEFTGFKVENLAEGQKVDIVNESLSVTFRGLADDIAKIDASNVTIVADFQNKVHTKGKNNIPVYAVIPDTHKVGVQGKYYLTVNVE